MRLKLIVLETVFLLLAFALGASAQAQYAAKGRKFSYPGSAWTEVGNYSPSEATVLSNSYIEQGITVARFGKFSLTPYVGLGLGFDTKELFWENRVVGQIGVKLTRGFNHGIISVGTAYAAENRFKGTNFQQGAVKKSLTGYVNYWMGWHNVSSSRFPGSSWGTIGNLSPFEYGNVIAVLHAEQGIVAARVGRTAIVPFGESTTSRDTYGHDWNNRELYGGGLKFVIPSSHAVAELGGKFLNETRFNFGARSASGFGLFLNVWTGWGKR